MEAEQLVASGSTFLLVMDHARTIEGMRHEAYGGGDKRPHAAGVVLVVLTPEVTLPYVYAVFLNSHGRGVISFLRRDG
ncbi:hypothetical protein HAX54_028820 [Datura stramonium]|uniref:Uncharacterized protein n=1 Tax=Datura stramonium TaxID=4076 RepID=A0ABS8V570_DATST|nr:hypothetical protein [Datura stramonium]